MKFCIDMVFCLGLVEVNNNYYYRFVFDKLYYGKSVKVKMTFYISLVNG